MHLNKYYDVCANARDVKLVGKVMNSAQV